MNDTDRLLGLYKRAADLAKDAYDLCVRAENAEDLLREFVAALPVGRVLCATDNKPFDHGALNKVKYKAEQLLEKLS